MKRPTSYIIGILGFILILGSILFLTRIFESEKPILEIKGLSEYICSPARIFVSISDKNMGLKKIEIILVQKNKKAIILRRNFPKLDILNTKGTHEFHKIIIFDPLKLGLSDGKAILKICAIDYSLRNRGKGNITILKKDVIVDTTPPNITPISKLNYFYIGGSGLLIYEVSKDTVKTGIYVNNLFFPAYIINTPSKYGDYYACYIGIPYYIKEPVDIHIWAKDKAGNSSTANFYYRIKRKIFRKRKIIITDSFLKKVLPFFSRYPFNSKDNMIQRFLKINRDLRKKNAAFIKSLISKTSKKRLWKGAWVYLKDSLCTARFGDHRSYFYKGKLIDHQVHLGIDLASIANSPIPATNNGKIIFCGRLGIYGFSVIIDHGQGIFSLYGHMSRIDVKQGQFVKKGDIIGITGQTGLAGGDHLHFSILINGIFVNPEEWLDYHWLKDNIIRKLKMVGGYK